MDVPITIPPLAKGRVGGVLQLIQLTLSKFPPWQGEESIFEVIN